MDVEEEVAKYKKYAERMRPLVTNSIAYIHKCLHSNKKVLVEGANAAMLDIDFGEWVQPCVRRGRGPLIFCINYTFHGIDMKVASLTYITITATTNTFSANQ